MTGKYSVYTLYEGHEIMFHVSTLLPFSRDNRQQVSDAKSINNSSIVQISLNLPLSLQVERKRHIGNDIVNIVFIDGQYDECEFIPNNIKSQFTRILFSPQNIYLFELNFVFSLLNLSCCMFHPFSILSFLPIAFFQSIDSALRLFV